MDMRMHVRDGALLVATLALESPLPPAPLLSCQSRPPNLDLDPSSLRGRLFSGGVLLPRPCVFCCFAGWELTVSRLQPLLKHHKFNLY